MEVGIEFINFYGGVAYVNVSDIFERRGLDQSRLSNLMLGKKSIGLPCEDPVTNGVNAAKPILDQMTEMEKSQIEMVITCTESGIDFGKSISTYIHDYLGLSKKCRLFEMKQACYSATAALQLAASYIMSGASYGAKVLVISTDVAKFSVKDTYAEPSQAQGSIAMVVSAEPKVLKLDFGANGYCGYEVMDTCRPMPGIEAGSPDLSLLSYLDCVGNCFEHYQDKVDGVDFIDTFSYLVYHTPFPGMVKGAHRKMLRDLYRMKADAIEADFEKRVKPSLTYNFNVGNVYAASLYLALCGLIDTADIYEPTRIGLFSYGSGCSSEFFSGVITPESKRQVAKMHIGEKLENRYCLNMDEYDHLIALNAVLDNNVESLTVQFSEFEDLYNKTFEGKELLKLESIEGYHRKYRF